MKIDLDRLGIEYAEYCADEYFEKLKKQALLHDAGCKYYRIFISHYEVKQCEPYDFAAPWEADFVDEERTPGPIPFTDLAWRIPYFTHKWEVISPVETYSADRVGSVCLAFDVLVTQLPDSDVKSVKSLMRWALRANGWGNAGIAVRDLPAPPAFHRAYSRTHSP